jgi:hypothetical protein
MTQLGFVLSPVCVAVWCVVFIMARAPQVAAERSKSKSYRNQCCQKDRKARMKCHLLRASIEAMKMMAKRYKA